MPSGRRQLSALAGTGALTLTTLAISGCTTTQTTAARERLQSAREVAAQSSTVVRRAGSAVAVTGLAVVPRSGPNHLGALVVSLANRTARPVSDLPISVGYAVGRRQVDLNDSASLDYFQSHLPLLGAHASATWVFATGATVPAHAEPFARVGSTPTVAAGPIDATPELAVLVPDPGATRAGTVTVRVHDRSGIPQYDLPVYAWGTRGGRIVTAGATSISNIQGGSIETVRIHMAGDSDAVSLHAESLPTTYR